MCAARHISTSYAAVAEALSRMISRPSVSGLVCLAVAMGIGRFAFTPILPMMELPVATGGWIATSNYVGYLAGAVSAMALRWSPTTGIRVGLALVAGSTLAMAGVQELAWWIALRFVAGVASAWVLVNVSALGAPRPDIVFAGVGTGILIAGLACLALILIQASAAQAWLALGLAAAIAASLVWRVGEARSTSAQPRSRLQWTRANVLRVACYGAFGFGYIIPATFLPAMAKAVLTSPTAFGMVWPVFGAAAALSTLAAGRARARWTDRDIWIASLILMAAGVGVLVLPGIPATAAMLSSALLVGGTFMVATMAGIQEARRAGGDAARVLIAAMTSAFAIGQIAGPVAVGLVHDVDVSLAFSAALLATAALTLWRIR